MKLMALRADQLQEILQNMTKHKQYLEVRINKIYQNIEINENYQLYKCTVSSTEFIETEIVKTIVTETTNK